MLNGQSRLRSGPLLILIFLVAAASASYFLFSGEAPLAPVASITSPAPIAPLARTPADVETKLPTPSESIPEAQAKVEEAPVKEVILPPQPAANPPPVEQAPIVLPALVPLISQPISQPIAQASTAPVSPRPSPLLPEKVGLNLFVGLGLNYFQYREQLTDVNTTYRGFKAPSYHFGTEIEITKDLSLDASYKVTPLSFNNASVGLPTTQENWQTTVVQLRSKSQYFSSDKMEFTWLYGMQFQQMPLALFNNRDNMPTLRTLQMYNASVGAKRVGYINPYTRTTILGRFQYPLGSSTSESASFELKPQLSFDGALGIEKRVYPSTWMGLHWYGQYQSVDFKYNDHVATAEGQQSAFFSTLEFRFQVEY